MLAIASDKTVQKQYNPPSPHFIYNYQLSFVQCITGLFALFWYFSNFSPFCVVIWHCRGQYHAVWKKWEPTLKLSSTALNRDFHYCCSQLECRCTEYYYDTSKSICWWCRSGEIIMILNLFSSEAVTGWKYFSLKNTPSLWQHKQNKTNVTIYSPG